VGPTGPPGASSAPFPDNTAIVKDSVDATKQVQIEAGGVSTATMRVITMPDRDIDLGNTEDDMLRVSRTEVAVSAGATLTNSAFGKMHVLTGGSSYTLNLPTTPGAGAKVIGFRVPASVSSSVHITIAGTGFTTRVLDAGEVMIVEWDGSNYHRLLTSHRPALQTNLYLATTDIFNGLALAANTPTVLLSPINFTVVDGTSAIEIRLEGVVVAGSSGNLGSYILIDGTIKRLTGGALAYVSPGVPIRLPAGTLAAGTHTVAVYVYSLGANTIYCRTATYPNMEHLRMDVIEYKL
jgi:hypothetical protein